MGFSLTSYKFFPALRYTTYNGVALCEVCHHELHTRFGLKDFEFRLGYFHFIRSIIGQGKILNKILLKFRKHKQKRMTKTTKKKTTKKKVTTKAGGGLVDVPRDEEFARQEKEWQADSDAQLLRAYTELAQDTARLKAARARLESDRKNIDRILEMTRRGQ